MSRIHEALKRAEQERGGQGDAIPYNAASFASAAPALPRQEMPPVRSAAAGFTYDELLARCAPRQWSPDRSTMLFFNGDEHVYGAEQFRTLRSRLYQLREKMQPLKTILVTSSLPKEGKSFVAANLAQVLVRQHGRRAALIDADLRGARLHTALGTEAAPGLAEYLLGEADETAVLRRGPMENLFFVPAGRAVKNAAELVAGGRMKVLLSRLEPLFDWIIIDSPPAVPVSDATLLANYCDGVLLVVRSNATPFDAAKKTQRDFKDHRVLGVVLNGMDSRSTAYDHYYGAYGAKTKGAAPQSEA